MCGGGGVSGKAFSGFLAARFLTPPFMAKREPWSLQTNCVSLRLTSHPLCGQYMRSVVTDPSVGRERQSGSLNLFERERMKIREEKNDGGIVIESAVSIALVPVAVAGPVAPQEVSKESAYWQPHPGLNRAAFLKKLVLESFFDTKMNSLQSKGFSLRHYSYEKAHGHFGFGDQHLSPPHCRSE
jgi:hypothetical protein